VSVVEDLVDASTLATRLGVAAFDVEAWRRAGVLPSVLARSGHLFDLRKVRGIVGRMLKEKVDRAYRAYDNAIGIHIGHLPETMGVRRCESARRGGCPANKGKICSHYEKEVKPHFRQWQRALRAQERFQARHAADACT
jgi:hypothetical protein